MRNSILNSISTVTGINRVQVVVVVKSVLRTCLKQTRSFYCPMAASTAPLFAALERAAAGTVAAIRHRGHDSAMPGSGCLWQPAGSLSGTVC